MKAQYKMASIIAPWLPNVQAQAQKGISRENLPAKTQLQERYFVGHCQLGDSTEMLQCNSVYSGIF